MLGLAALRLELGDTCVSIVTNEHLRLKHCHICTFAHVTPRQNHKIPMRSAHVTVSNAVPPGTRLVIQGAYDNLHKAR